VAGQKKSFLLRIDPDLWEELNRWAAAELRSANGQIEFILRRAVDERRKGRRGPDGEPHRPEE
jgi:hypothetical protein